MKETIDKAETLNVIRSFISSLRPEATGLITDIYDAVNHLPSAQPEVADEFKKVLTILESAKDSKTDVPFELVKIAFRRLEAFVTDYVAVNHLSAVQSKPNDIKALDDEICVGDELKSKYIEDAIMVVTCIKDDCTVAGLRKDGMQTSWLKSECIKTGRHFNEIEQLLKKMKGDADD